MTEAADDDADRLAVALFSEMLTADQLVRARLTRALPKGMELSHFIVLNHLAQTPVERSPTELARTFHLTRGAVTNTLAKLEWAGHIHVRPDWDDARRKRVAISPSGIAARAAFSGAGGKSLIALALAAVIGGLILNLMPCVLPVLSIKAMGMVQAVASGHESEVRRDRKSVV